MQMVAPTLVLSLEKSFPSPQAARRLSTLSQMLLSLCLVPPMGEITNNKQYNWMSGLKTLKDKHEENRTWATNPKDDNWQDTYGDNSQCTSGESRDPHPIQMSPAKSIPRWTPLCINTANPGDNNNHEGTLVKLQDVIKPNKIKCKAIADVHDTKLLLGTLISNQQTQDWRHGCKCPGCQSK